MASEAAEARKKHEQMHRKVSVACDCYGTPVTPGKTRRQARAYGRTVSTAGMSKRQGASPSEP